MKTRDLVDEVAGAGCLSLAGLVPDGGMALAGAGLFLAFKNKFKSADQAAIDEAVKRVVKTARDELRLFHRPLDDAAFHQMLTEDDARRVVMEHLRHAMPARTRIVETAFDIGVLAPETVEALAARSNGKLDPSNSEAALIADAYVRAFLTALRAEQGFLVHLNAELTLEIARVVKTLNDKIDALTQEVSADKHVPVEALRTVARSFDRRLSGKYEKEELLDFLQDKAEEYRDLSEKIGRGRNISPEIGKLRAKAKEKLDAGEFDAARALLKQAREAQTRLRKEQEAEAAQRRSEEVELLTEEAEAAALALDLGAAGETYLLAANLLRTDDPDAATKLAFTAAGGLNLKAQRLGDNAALEHCVALYEFTLVLAPEGKQPQVWASTRHNLAITLSTLGQRRGDEDMLQRAVDACDAALTIRTREAAPVDWAITQNNLAMVLEVLGARRGDENLLQRAVEVSQAALDLFEGLGHAAYTEATQRTLSGTQATLDRLRGE